MARPLDGIRVVETGLGPVSGMAAMVLADFGADVVKVEPPGGDPWRSLPNAPLWLRGRRSIELDLRSSAGQAEAGRMAAAADVFLSTSLPAEAAALGCDFEALAAANPALVYCRVTGFGTKGPYAGYPAYPSIVDAKAGRMQVFSTIAERQGPGYAALPVSMHATAQGAVTAIVAALFERESSGLGQLVETSLLQGLMPYDLVSLLMAQLARRYPDRFAAMAASGALLPTLNYHPLPAKDGRWMQMGNLLQHLFDNFLAATGLDDVYTDPRYQSPQAEWLPEAREEFRDRMLLHMKTRTSEEWMEAFVANGGVAATAYHSTQEAMDDPDMVANGYVVEQDHPELGAVRMLGPLGQFCETPGQPGGPAPAAGQDNASIGAIWTSVPARPPAATAAPTAKGPLAGLTILEFATIIATPLGVSALGDLGARVIKVEPLGGDPYRAMGSPGTMTVKTNASKESIGIDLKRPEGQAIVDRLLAGADALIHNYRPGVPERLGIGYEHARSIRPDIVYVAVNGYGPNGPGAHRPSTHPIPGAAMGGASQQSAAAYLWDGQTADDLRKIAIRLFKSNESNPDPNTSAVVASATALALFARKRLGVGQQVFLDMMGANAYANAGDFIQYDGKKPLQWPDVLLHGLSATYRLYPAASGWVFLALPTDADFSRFCELTGASALSGPEFATAQARAANDAALADALGALLKARDADEWEQLLAPKGIGCVRADGPGPGEFWADDPHVRENGFVVKADHARFGDHLRWGPVATLSRTPTVDLPGALGGDCTAAIMAELGYTPDETDRLFASNVLWAEPVDRLP